MNWIPFFLAVAFVVGIFVASILWRRFSVEGEPAQLSGDYPYERSKILLNEMEHAFHKVLTHELGGELYVFPKVRLGDLLTVGKKVERRSFYLNLVRGQPVDFVLCEFNQVMPVLVILLGDVNSDRTRGEDTELIEQILRSANMPMLRLPLNHSYGPTELRNMIRDAIKNRGAEASTVT